MASGQWIPLLARERSKFQRGEGQFLGLAVVYNLDRKTLAKMNRALGRDVEADDILTYTSAEDSDNLV